MTGSSSDLERKRRKTHGCCRFLFWSTVLLVIIAATITATIAIINLNECSLPYVSSARAWVSSSNSPVISTNTKDAGALVTVSRVTAGEPINIFLDSNCPNYSENFQRWEVLQSSLLTEMQKLSKELKMLLGHTHHLQVESDRLKGGQAVLNQSLDSVNREQSHILQMLSQDHTGVLKMAKDFNDSLLSLQRETAESLSKLKEELQRHNTSTAVKPRDCSDIMASGVTQDGVYSVFPDHDPTGFMVYCDMTTEGGGWTVIQRREDGSVNFYRGWDAYRDGFGTTTGEHWLGLQRIYTLTRSGGYELRIDMADFENATAFAHYADFSVGQDSVNPEEDGYPLTVAQYSGTAGDSLLRHSGMQFTTKDRDQDQSENNCATYYQGAWWYRKCHTSNLNGQYLSGDHTSYADGVEWSSWTGWQYSLRFTEMKIRPNSKPES